jgi:DNA polymerase-1
MNDDDGKFSWGGGVESETKWTGLTTMIVDRKIRLWSELAGGSSDNCIIVFSDKDGENFRKDFCPHYKENRMDFEKPDDYALAVAHVEANYKSYTLPRLEGDDVLGLLCTGPNGNKYVAVSTDKDIFTIPGKVLHIPHYKSKEKARIKLNTMQQADNYWMTQTLTGDTVDNYFGCPGVGKVGAAETLHRVTTLKAMWDAVLMRYADHHDNKRWFEKFRTDSAYDEALMNARCARILRYGDWNKETKEVTLWTP